MFLWENDFEVLVAVEIMSGTLRFLSLENPLSSHLSFARSSATHSVPFDVARVVASLELSACLCICLVLDRTEVKTETVELGASMFPFDPDSPIMD